MPSFLIVERDESTVDKLRSALEAEGWPVTVAADVDAARGSLQNSAPDVVLVAAELEGAGELLEATSRQQRGDGSASIALGGGDAEGGDAVLARPVEQAALLAEIRRLLAASGPAPASADRPKLTSEDIFGDLLAEVEGGERPKSEEASQAPAAPAAKPSRASASKDLDRELEKTLSGLLEIRKPAKARPGKPAGAASVVPPTSGEDSGAGKGPSPKAPPTGFQADDDDIDQLLDKTLSGLEIPRSLRSSRKAEPAKEEPPKAEPEAREPESVAEAPPPVVEPPATVEESGPLREVEDSRTRPEAPVTEVQEPEAPAEETQEPEEEGSAVGLQPVEEAPAGAEIYRTQMLSRELLKPEDDRAFGHYTLLDRIAVGGMAEVWKARMDGVAGFQKTVAIKRILPHLTENEEFERMFVDEAKLAAKLNHPNIIHIYDLGKIQQDYYIAMEYVEGRDLRSILNLAQRREQKMPHGLAGLIALRLASALEYAHRRRDGEDQDLKLVHRDVSPQNVLISYEGDIKLCDFGIAKAMSTASHTQMGALKGKIQYMSPEQAWGKKVDSRSDLYSLGAILFEMLSGRRLYAGDNELSILEAVREGRADSPRAVEASVPEALNAVVEKALAKEPEERYQTAEAFRDDLAEALEKANLRPNNAELSAYLRRLSEPEPEAPVEATILQEETDEEAAEPATLEPMPAAEPEPADEPELEVVAEDDDEEALEAVPTAVPIAGTPEPVSPAPQEAAVATEPETADEAGETAVSDAEVTGPVVEAVPPEGEVQEEAEGSRRWWLIAAILLLLVGSIVAFLLLRPDSAGESPDVPSPEAPTTTLPPTTPTDGDGAEDGATETLLLGEDGEDGEAEPVEGGAGTEGAAASDDGGDLGSQIDRSLLEHQAAEALAEQQAQLEETYAAQERELQRKLAELEQEDEAPAAADEGTDATETGEPRDAASEPGTDDGEAETSAGAASETSPPPPAQVEPPPPPVHTPPPPPARAEPPPPPSRPAEPPPPPPVRPGQLVSPGPGVQPPKLVSIDKPRYPPAARRGRVEGEVVISALVDQNGRVKEVKIVRGSGSKLGLDEAAVAAAKTARFQPAVKEGVRVSMWATLKIPFKL